MNNERVVELLRDLIAIPSVNPVYDPASPGEGGMAACVEAWATGLGLPVERQNVFPGRDNILVRLAGPEGAPILLFEAHMDTVGIDGMSAPFAPEVRDDRVYGRGACDTKGSLAAMMAAVERLVSDGAALACTVELLAAVDEETSGKGALAFV
ncbi:MAG: M20/M25/M40 family metallo-hydrolase, partial [Chloroflexia bacterium]|nr:M20/M25/M40 family metallo-hydrolase [Chloroflexia bacterium]